MHKIMQSFWAAVVMLAMMCGSAGASQLAWGGSSHSFSSGSSHSFSTHSSYGSSSHSSYGSGSTKIRTPSYSHSSTSTKIKVPTNSNRTITKSTQHFSTKTISGATIKNSTPLRSVPRTARASGASYSYGGHTWTYNRTVYSGYYRSYHGGYPAYGTPLYWSLWQSPYYLPNYSHVGNIWYGHAYPVGYVIQGNQLVSVHHGHHIIIFLFLGLLLVAVVVTAVVLLKRSL